MNTDLVSLGYLTLGAQFLQLAEQGCVEIISHDNQTTTLSDTPIPPETCVDLTRWSDRSVGTPLLFNFFHGVELIMKGFLIGIFPKINHHRLTELLKAFEKAYRNSDLTKEIRRTLPASSDQSPIGRFLTTNGIEIDEWFEALKYPVSKKGKQFSHRDLKYGGSEAIVFWIAVRDSAVQIRIKARQFTKNYRPHEYSCKIEHHQ